MKRLMLIVFLIFCLASTMISQVTQTGCSKLSKITPLVQLGVNDNAEHDPAFNNMFPGSSNLHGVATGTYDFSHTPLPPLSDQNSSLQGQCTYTSGSSANCDTACSITFFGNATVAETGVLINNGVHNVNFGSANAPQKGVGTGANCGVAIAAGAANCNGVSGGCFVSATVTVSPTGVTGAVTVNSNGTPVWSSATSGTLTCASQVDPDKKRVDGGVPPNPCLNGANVNLVSGAFTTPTCSPVIIDTEGEGFHLTSAANGVFFDIAGSGHPVQIAWTARGSHNAFLVLDRNGDGLINDGTELFGNFTVQDASQHMNGFLALAEFDEPDQGGNGDGVIDEKDAVYTKLRLWIDENHDGISQPSELHKLSEYGIHSLSLGYFESHKTDQFGNQFRYKARVNPGRQRDRRDETESGEPGRWAYDVFFMGK